MSLRRFSLLCCMILLVGIFSGVAGAQGAPSSQVIALTTAGGTLTAGVVDLPGLALTADLNPVDPVRYARVDEVGMLRFVPAGGPEGVYSFSPYFDGYSAPSAEENRLSIAEVDWSPNGEMLAFRIAGHDLGSTDSGVWFWQPAREISTDPSYHILRDCPPGCDLVTRDQVLEWRSIQMDWAPTSDAILVTVELPLDDNRRALTVRYPARDFDNVQSRTGPQVWFFDYGNWSADGQRVIVSGRDSTGMAVFGSIGRDGSSPLLTPAADIGMVWVQDAVQNSQTGQIIMLGSQVSANGPVQLIDNTGQPLTVPLGGGKPENVVWNDARTAVRVTVDGRVYVAEVNGTVTDITDLVQGAAAIDWLDRSLPTTARRLTLPEPLATADTLQAEDIQTEAITPEPANFLVGQLLQVIVPDLTLHMEPLATSDVVATLGVGETVIITDGPLTDANGMTWWRIQTIDVNGWIPATRDELPALGPVDEPTG